MIEENKKTEGSQQSSQILGQLTLYIKADILPKYRYQKKKKAIQSILLTKLADRICLQCLYYFQHSFSCSTPATEVAARLPLNLQCLSAYRVSKSDEPGQLNRTTETSWFCSQIGIPEWEAVCQFHQCLDNPTEETAVLLACVSLQRQDHQSNKSVMPPFSLSLYSRHSFTWSSCFSFL